ncbi:MAG TPA: carbohydrate kinase [Myxococcales bacterium]|nr:carbohydrate kinase [Myxococcales bacterium]
MTALDVLCFGEALVDLLPDRRGKLRDCERFSVHSGGAPANVAVGLARLGLRTAFCGVVGDDEFGHLLDRKLRDEGIETRFRFVREARTGLWFVALDERGERSFFSPGGPDSADKMVIEEDALAAPIERAGWLHCGSSCHVRPQAQRALQTIVRRAHAASVRVSFDPNVRAHLWRDLRALRALCESVFPMCTIVKLSDDECETCVGERDPERVALRLRDAGVRLICITRGERGASALRGDKWFHAGAPAVEVADTTGAGDGFVAGLLSRLARDPEPSDEALQSALEFACTVGSSVCTKLGAVAGLPRRG